MKVDPDSELIIYSYLSTEEILTICDYQTAEKIIRYGKLQIPDIQKASENGDFETIKYLISRNKNPENTASDAIYYLATFGHLEIIKYLKNAGYKILSRVVDIAVFNNRLDLVKYFIEDLKFKPRPDIIKEANKKGNLEVILYLILKGYRLPYQIRLPENKKHLITPEISKYVRNACYSFVY